MPLSHEGSPEFPIPQPDSARRLLWIRPLLGALAFAGASFFAGRLTAPERAIRPHFEHSLFDHPVFIPMPIGEGRLVEMTCRDRDSLSRLEVHGTVIIRAGKNFSLSDVAVMDSFGPGILVVTEPVDNLREALPPTVSDFLLNAERVHVALNKQATKEN
jgi:hypothetical protein